jgi:hypothetical protein
MRSLRRSRFGSILLLPTRHDQDPRFRGGVAGEESDDDANPVDGATNAIATQSSLEKKRAENAVVATRNFLIMMGIFVLAGRWLRRERG